MSAGSSVPRASSTLKRASSDSKTVSALIKRARLRMRSPSGTAGVPPASAAATNAGGGELTCQSGGHTACFLADACPTSAHLPLPWVMGYDLEPLVSLETKRMLWTRARAESWLLIFEHDPMVAWGRLAPGEDKPTLVPLDD